MIKLKYEHIFRDNFILACQAMYMTRFRGYQEPRNVVKIKKGLEAEIQIARELYKKEFEPYFELDENGMPIPERNATAPFKLKDETKDEYSKKFSEFLNTEFTIDAEKINTEFILEARLSPLMVENLEDLLCEKEE